MTGVYLPPVAFIGKMGAGKTECANILIERFGYERLSFAEPLKIGCGTRDDRALLQRVGHGVRELFPDFWVNLAMHDYEQRKTWPDARFVNDDTRYANEATILKANGFVIVRVVASKAMRVDRLKRNGRLQDESQLNHDSELQLDDFPHDHRIVNDGWPEDLVDELAEILNVERS
jgi:hypothetical protein